MDGNAMTEQLLDFDMLDGMNMLLDGVEDYLGLSPQDGQSSPGRDSLASDSSFDGASSPNEHQQLDLPEDGINLLEYLGFGDGLNLQGGGDNMESMPVMPIKSEPGSADILKQASQAADIPGEVADVNMELSPELCSLSCTSDSDMSGTNDPFLSQSDPLLSQTVKSEPVSPTHFAGVGENKESWFTVDADHSGPVGKIWQSDRMNSSDSVEPVVHVSVKGKRGPVVETQTETEGYFLSLPDGRESRAPFVADQPEQPSRSSSSDTAHLPVGDVKSKASKRTPRKRKSEPMEVPVPMSTLEQLQFELDNEPDKQKKNAIIAKLNREKKKLHISCLEEQNRVLSEENGSLKRKLEKTEKSHELLEEEVIYLKSVIANQSTLSDLLKSINPSSLNLTTSFNLDHDYEGSIKRSRSDVAPTGGVCLHVANQQVSMEFCAKCAQMANGAKRKDLDGV